MKDIEIRDLTVTDIYERCPEFLKVMMELGEANISKEAALSFYFERQYCGIRTLVLTLDDIIIGAATFFIEPKYIHNGGKVCHVEDVAVLNDYHRSGLGVMIMKEIIEAAKKSGCYKIVLDCKHNVIPFYEKLGFHQHEVQMRLDLDGI